MSLELAVSIFALVLQLLVAPLLGWVALRLIKQLDEASKGVSQLQAELMLMRKDLESAHALAKSEQNTLWRRIDELKAAKAHKDAEIKVLRNRDHKIRQWLTIVAIHLEKLGHPIKSKFDFDDEQFPVMEEQEI